MTSCNVSGHLIKVSSYIQAHYYYANAKHYLNVEQTRAHAVHAYRPLYISL